MYFQRQCLYLSKAKKPFLVKMSGTGKPVHVLRRSPIQQNGTSSQGGKVSKTPQSRGTKSSKIVLAPMNGELGRQEDVKSSGMRGRSSSFGREEMNLMAARKADPSVTNILSTVAQVKLYRYDQDLVEWVSPCSLKCMQTLLCNT